MQQLMTWKKNGKKQKIKVCDKINYKKSLAEFFLYYIIKCCML